MHKRAMGISNMAIIKGLQLHEGQAYYVTITGWYNIYCIYRFISVECYLSLFLARHLTQTNNCFQYLKDHYIKLFLLRFF